MKGEFIWRGIRACNYCFQYAWNNFPIQLIKFFFFAVLAANILLEENNSIVLFPAITYLMSLTFDSIQILKKEYGDSIGGSCIYFMHRVIFLSGIAAILALILQDYMHLSVIPYKRMVLNIVIIISIPHPLIEGYCNSLGEN